MSPLAKKHLDTLLGSYSKMSDTEGVWQVFCEIRGFLTALMYSSLLTDEEFDKYCDLSRDSRIFNLERVG